MAKYSYEFKLKIVQEYLSGGGGIPSLTKKYDLGSNSVLRKWVASYRHFGPEGLKRKRKNRVYPFEFKMHVVKLYLTSELSYQDLALQVGINNPPLITRWVNDFQVAGPDALKSKRRGPKPKMSEIKDKKIKKSNSNDEYVKQLEEENKNLRIELAYLKELRRLRQKVKKPKNKQK
jgi:transposase